MKHLTLLFLLLVCHKSRGQEFFYWGYDGQDIFPTYIFPLGESLISVNNYSNDSTFSYSIVRNETTNSFETLFEINESSRLYFTYENQLHIISTTGNNYVLRRFDINLAIENTYELAYPSNSYLYEAIPTINGIILCYRIGLMVYVDLLDYEGSVQETVELGEYWTEYPSSSSNSFKVTDDEILIGLDCNHILKANSTNLQETEWVNTLTTAICGNNGVLIQDRQSNYFRELLSQSIINNSNGYDGVVLIRRFPMETSNPILYEFQDNIDLSVYGMEILSNGNILFPANTDNFYEENEFRYYVTDSLANQLSVYSHEEQGYSFAFIRSMKYNSDLWLYGVRRNVNDSIHGAFAFRIHEEDLITAVQSRQENSLNDLVVVNNTLYYNNENMDEVIITIYSTHGQQISSESTHSNHFQFPNMSNGIYIVEVQSRKEVVRMKLYYNPSN